MPPTTSRLDVVDALRGFAIVSIMLLHNIEHFDLSHTVQGLPAWLQALDSMIWDTAFFLFGGKSYAIFAFLFGLTFFIQYDRRRQVGEDFRLRYAWRLGLLFAFGMFNSLFYQGDILTFYAVIGLVLLPVARLSNRALAAIAVLLMLQPWLCGDLIAALQQPGLQAPDPRSWTYFGLSGAYLKGDSLLATWFGNVSNGKLAAVLWSWENGRMFQIPSLFMFGMLAGRASLFVMGEASQRFWRRLLLWALVAFVPLFTLRKELKALVDSGAVRRPLGTIISTWSNLAFMLVLVAGFVLLYRSGWGERLLRKLAPLGRMSLTSYVMQSLAGSFIYYGFGLGLYQYTNPSACLLIGIVLATAQCMFSNWWLRRHRQGPLEAVWHRATWIGRTPSAARA